MKGDDRGMSDKSDKSDWSDWSDWSDKSDLSYLPHSPISLLLHSHLEGSTSRQIVSA